MCINAEVSGIEMGAGWSGEVAYTAGSDEYEGRSVEDWMGVSDLG